LNPNRRSKQPLTEDEKALINTALKESKLDGAVAMQ